MTEWMHIGEGSAWVLQLPHGIWLAGLCALGASWWRHHAEDRRAIVLAAIAFGVWTLAALTIGPRLPVTALQPLREAFTATYLQHLAGRMLDVGPMPERVWRPMLTGGPDSLREAVTAGLVVAGWCVIGVALLVRRVVPDRALGAAVVVAFALNPAWLDAATGPLYAPYVGLYVLVGAWLLAAWRDPTLPTGPRALALVLLFACGVWLVGVRDELAAVALATWVAALVPRRVEDRWAAVGLRIARGLRRRWWAVLVALAAWVWVSDTWRLGATPPPSWGQWRWLAAGLHPGHVHGLTLPLVLLGMIPVGAVLLALRGAAVVLVRPARWAFVPVLLWVLFVTARIAAHGRVEVDGQNQVAPYELYRYVTLLLPLVFVLVVAGARAWSGLRGLPRALLVASCLLPAVPEVTRLLDVAGGPGAAWPRFYGFDLDPQGEIRFLQARMDAAPHCGILTLGHIWRGNPGPESFAWTALRPVDHGWTVVASAAPTGADVDGVARDLLHDLPCAVAYRSVDCFEAHGDHCVALDGLDVLAEEVRPHRRFVHPQHGGSWQGPLRLALLALPGWPVDEGDAPASDPRAPSAGQGPTSSQETATAPTP
ncbi:MAG: hypothetical protein H6733_07530 [Alphaproteobacteria bacterium]|nr:hypothetical protein [Alphaproteobacteria bacterium]